MLRANNTDPHTHTHAQHILESSNQPKLENDSLLKNLALSTLKKSFIMIKHVGVFDIYRYSNKTKYSWIIPMKHSSSPLSFFFIKIKQTEKIRVPQVRSLTLGGITIIFVYGKNNKDFDNVWNFLYFDNDDNDDWLTSQFEIQIFVLLRFFLFHSQQLNSPESHII